MKLEIDNIYFEYPGFSLSADINIPGGAFLSILGPSGCGKSTLLRMIGGFIKPVKGSITSGGIDITRLNPEKRNFGMVFQDYALFPHMNVEKNIAYGLKIQKKTAAEINYRIDELLEVVRLTGYRHRSIHELSGGEKQRIALARALAPNPPVMLFDEPLSALDVKLRKELRTEIKRIQNEIGFTAVYVTHDQEEALAVSDLIAVMNRGRILQTGTPEEVYENPEDKFTAGFLGEMNTVNLDIHGDTRIITFRPENCVILENAESEPVLKIRIGNIEYTGGRYKCIGYTESKEAVIFYSRKKYSLNESVHLGIEKYN